MEYESVIQKDFFGNVILPLWWSGENMSYLNMVIVEEKAVCIIWLFGNKVHYQNAALSQDSV